MLKNKFSYYFWRVAIGVSIGLILMFARGKAYALSYDFKTEEPFAFWDSNQTFNFNSSCYNSSGTGTYERTFNHSYLNTQYDYIMFNYNLTTTYGLYDGNTALIKSSTSFVWLIFDEGATNCTYDSGMLLCPLLKNKTMQKIRFTYPCTQQYYDFTFTFTRYGTFLSSSTDSIENSSKETAQNTKETAENTKKIADEISDNSDANIDVSGMSGVTGLLPAGPLDSLLALPVNLLNILVNSTSGSCQPFTFTFVFDSEWSLPCFDTFWNQVPSSLLLFMSDLPAVYIFIKWAKSIYSRVERAVSFESSVEDEWGGV